MHILLLLVVLVHSDGAMRSKIGKAIGTRSKLRVWLHTQHV
jgi:hypothetical protein